MAAALMRIAPAAALLACYVTVAFLVLMEMILLLLLLLLLGGGWLRDYEVNCCCSDGITFAAVLFVPLLLLVMECLSLILLLAAVELSDAV